MSDERATDGVGTRATDGVDPRSTPGAQAPWSAPGRAPAPPGPEERHSGAGAPRQTPDAPSPSGPPVAQPPYGQPALPPPYPAPEVPGAPGGPGGPSGPDGPGDTAPFATNQRERDRVFAGPGYTSAGLRNDGFAVAAMVVGLVGIVVPGLCLVAIAMGHVSLRRLRTSYSGGRGLAVTGLVLGYAGLAIWLSLLLLYLALVAFT